MGRLKQLLRHAWNECPFYRSRLEEAGLHPDAFRDLSDLQRLPPTEKRDIQKHRDEMVARCWKREELILNRTGGSTGEPISFYLTVRASLVCARRQRGGTIAGRVTTSATRRPSSGVHLPTDQARRGRLEFGTLCSIGSSTWTRRICPRRLRCSSTDASSGFSRRSSRGMPAHLPGWQKSSKTGTSFRGSRRRSYHRPRY